MEEWVGSIWHKYITKKASEDFEEARVDFSNIKKSAALIFRSLGGEPTKRVEAAAPRDYIVQRSLLQKVSGSHHQYSLAWQDDESLRLPESIAIFPNAQLNKSLYLWLAALAAYQLVPFKHWGIDNQKLVKKVLDKHPILAHQYQRLASALLALRPAISSLPKAQQPLERAIVDAIKHPGTVTDFPSSNFAPAPVYLWLYPSAKVDKPLMPDNTQMPPQSESSKSKKDSQAARKKSERTDYKENSDGLMAFRLESLLSWGEFTKLNRATDDSDDDDGKRVAEDLDILTLSQEQDQKSARLKIDLDLPAADNDDIRVGDGIKLPEWNYKIQQLVSDRCLLQPMLPKGSEPLQLPARLTRSAKQIRAQFQQLQSVKQWQKSQPQGEEIDLSAWLDFHVQCTVGPTQEHGLYQTFSANHRDLSCLLLADISMSTDAYINDNQRVIDVINDSLLLFGEALNAVGDSFAMYGFSSVRRNHVRFSLIKNFNECYNDDVRGRIQRLSPGFYTRMGAAIRQATKVLSAQTQSQKLLLILTDGKPNDIDHYEGRFGIEDTRQAVLEAKRAGLRPFCITIDEKADEYLPYLFGSDGFTLIAKPEQLPQKLPLLYHQLTY